jgi:hypothetical protein
MFILVCILVLGVVSAFSLSDKSVGIVSSVSKIKDSQNDNKVIMYRDKIPIQVDYDKGVLIAQGREIPIIIDDFGEKDTEFKITDPSTKDWVNLSYDRFEVHIEPGYYANNTDELNLFFDRFEPRYELMESLTDWSAEEYYGEKLEIYVEGGSTCGGGYAIPAEAHFSLYENLSNLDVCKFPYYVDGIPYYDNPGELGDHWKYMTTALHEALHSINPFPTYSRAWLTEGWSEYCEFNILSSPSFEDINQETTDYYLYNGWIIPSWYSWELYVANDYHDTTPGQYEIQESLGYDITAWMFSMLRDDYSLPWEDFYALVDNNPETLDKSWELGGEGYTSIFTDTHVIDVFERATGVEMYPVFRYDGPEGPGWGVRQWEDLDWYADLVPELEVSDPLPEPGQEILLTSTIYNNGDVSLNDVIVRFYAVECDYANETNLIYSLPSEGDGDSSLLSLSDPVGEYSVSVAGQGSTFVGPVPYTVSRGMYCTKVTVDEDDLKIEQDETNNYDTVIVNSACGDVTNNTIVDLADVIFLVNYLYRNGPEPICDPIQICGDSTLDGNIDLADLIFLINYLYRNGPEPCSGKASSMPINAPNTYEGAMRLLNQAKSKNTDKKDIIFM